MSTGRPSSPIRRSRWRRPLLLAAAALAALAAWLLFVPLPKAAIPWVMTSSSGWLLSNYEGPGPLPARTGRKLVGLWVQQGLAAHAYRSQPLPEEMDDAQKIIRRLVDLKRKLISQAEVVHGPADAPVAVAGLAWCDGTNGFAATILSHEFPRAEIVGVLDRELRTGHSFGRVWSHRIDDWLYFDVWTDEVVVFRSRPGAGAEFLARARPLGERRLPLESPETYRRMYDRAHQGIVQYRVQPTLGGYLFSRLANLVSNGTTSPEGTVEAIAEASAITRPNDPRLVTPTRPAASEAYLRARFHHLLGEEARALEAYRAVVEAERGRGRGSAYAEAARIFVSRLGG